MPEHLRSETTDLVPLIIEEDKAEEALRRPVEQSPRKGRDVEASDEDEDEDDLEDDDLEDEEDDDLEDEDEDEEDAEPEESKVKKEAVDLFKNPLPPRSKVSPELLPVWDALNSARKGQNADYTQKTQELSDLRKRLTPFEEALRDIEEAGQNPQEFAEGVRNLAAAVKESGGNTEQALARFNETQNARNGNDPVLQRGRLTLDEVLDNDGQLAEWADDLSDPDNLTEREISALTAAYRAREQAIAVAVNQHNRDYDDRLKNAEGDRTLSLEALKKDELYGRIATKHSDALLAEAKRRGTTDVKSVLRDLYFDDLLKQKERDGRRKLTVSRRKNLDVGDGPGDGFDVEDVSTSELDKAFDSGGLAAMMEVNRPRLTGSRKKVRR